ncbi:hypothetical protein QJS10_CPA08g01529 [Acorus calamus]|uniref:Uncharacterized protein n=1 Tax=Acorus calamus TaxID=4465 RepID=A0AAV9EC48_ACOCL|nr:hypothetical protein QJS10_CPA08g01529 [Acorus calamus]
MAEVAAAQGQGKPKSPPKPPKAPKPPKPVKPINVMCKNKLYPYCLHKKYGVTDEDCFAHLEMGFKFFTLSTDVHGVLGQTYRDDYMSRVKMSSDMPIMSGTHLYSSSGIFAADCAVSRYGQRGGGLALPSSSSEGYADMKCGSGISGGRGIVCKK